MEKIYRLTNDEKEFDTLLLEDDETVKLYAEFGITVTGGWKSGSVPFEALPKEIKEKVLDTLMAYDNCGVVHENGKFKVGGGSCIKSHYATDYFVCGNYKADELYTPEQREKNFLEVFGYRRRVK